MAEQIHHFELEKSYNNLNWLPVDLNISPVPPHRYDHSEIPAPGEVIYYKLTGITSPSGLTIPYNIVSISSPPLDLLSLSLTPQPPGALLQWQAAVSADHYVLSKSTSGLPDDWVSVDNNIGANIIQYSDNTVPNPTVLYRLIAVTANGMEVEYNQVASTDATVFYRQDWESGVQPAGWFDLFNTPGGTPKSWKYFESPINGKYSLRSGGSVFYPDYLRGVFYWFDQQLDGQSIYLGDFTISFLLKVLAYPNHLFPTEIIDLLNWGQTPHSGLETMNVYIRSDGFLVVQAQVGYNKDNFLTEQIPLNRPMKMWLRWKINAVGNEGLCRFGWSFDGIEPTDVATGRCIPISFCRFNLPINTFLLGPTQTMSATEIFIFDEIEVLNTSGL